MPNTVLLYGSASSPVMFLIWQALLSSGQRHVAFLPQELFLRQANFCMRLEPGAPLSGSYSFPTDLSVNFDDLVSVCMENYYVSTAGYTGFSEKDISYVRMEGWALLLALGGGLAERCVVANLPPRADFLFNRSGRMLLLQRHGFSVPRFVVCSDPARARAFYEECQGQVLYKHVVQQDAALQPMAAADLERIDNVSRCPIHMEENSAGRWMRVVVVGKETFPLLEAADGSRMGLVQLEEDNAAKCLRLCEDIGASLCEIGFRISPQGQAQAVNIYPFVTLAALHYFDHPARYPIRDAVTRLLEAGEGAPESGVKV